MPDKTPDETPDRTPGLDVATANVARMYDYYLGGKDNFAADRAAAERVLATAPEARTAARANRAFLGRAVHYLAAECGVRQFVDIGAGLPSQGAVHEVAHRVDPDARVVYVDYDPVVGAHAEALLACHDTIRFVPADLRDPADVLGHPGTRALIDFDQPVAVLLVAILHFLPDADDPAGVVARLRDALAPGSYLVVSHASLGGRTEGDLDEALEAYRRSSAAIVTRTPEEIRGFFAGCTLVQPGLVPVQHWRTELPLQWRNEHGEAVILAGVGRTR